MKKTNEKILNKEALRELAIDANIKSELQKNIEEEKMTQKMNKVSQKLYNFYVYKKPEKKKVQEEKIEESEN